MFGFLKKKAAAEVIPAASGNSIEEEMGLKEYVSFDSVKAHLVEILEENRRVCRRLRAKKMRLFTVPRGRPILSAISLYL